MRYSLFFYLCLVMIVSLIVNLILNKFYKIGILKIFVFTILSTVLGSLSTMVMSYIESGNITGTSFYGAVFLMPIIVCGLAILFRAEKWKFLNMTAFLGMLTSVILKIRCYAYGCCGGRMILTDNFLGYYIFPSQIVELVFAVVVFFILGILFMIKKDRKDLYPIMMIIYGVGRFILNSYRRVTPIFWFMAYGHIWSILSVIIGFIWLVILYKKKCKV